MADGFRCMRSFGAPERLRISKRTVLCVCGDLLPEKISLNGLDIPIQQIGASKIQADIGTQLAERNRVVLHWHFNGVNRPPQRGLESLHEVFLEIWE